MISIYNDAPMIYACHCNISDGGGNNEEVDDIDDDKMMITIENIWTDMTDMTLMMVQNHQELHRISLPLDL